MSHLEKIQIQGIRSFDSNGPQVVKFFPLTIILGPNGAGKTSIIEALKYVTTGVTPPNSGGGKTFILDPIIANCATVRAQVKLSFHNLQKEKTVVTRSMELRSTKSKAKNSKTTYCFKSINGVIRVGDKAIDQRCVDVNNEMLELLGVSKAVLTNVIFCHQEDSNWPLSEGKVLKEKFDDIFGSLGYVKALDKIKKSRKTELEKYKLLHKDVDHWQHIRKEFDSKSKDIERLNSELSELKSNFIESETKLSAAKTELDRINSKEESIHSLSDRINQLKGRITEKQKSLNRQKSQIKNLYNGSEEQLKEEIANFKANVLKSEEIRTSLKNKDSNLGTNYSELNRIQQNLNKDLTKLQIDEENHKKLLKQRNQLVSKLVKEINVSIGSNISNKLDSDRSLDSNDMTFVMKLINERFSELNTNLSDRKTSEQKKIQELRQQLNELKSSKGKYEHEVQLWNSQQTDKMNSRKELKSKLIGFSKSDAKYNEINDNIKRLTDEIKQMEALNIDKKKKDLENKEKEKKELKLEINSMEKKDKELQQQNEDRIKYEMFSKQKKDRERKRDQINEIHGEVIQSVGAIDGMFHSSLSSHIQSINSRIETKSKELSIKENQLTSESTKESMKSDSVLKMKRQLKESETKVKRICKLDEYESRVKRVESELKQLRQRLSEVTNYQPFIKSQIDSIESSKCCPVCERDVNSEWMSKKGIKLNKQSLVQRLENLVIQTSPEELEDQLKSKEKEWNQLNDLRSTVQLMVSLNESIPKLETEIESIVEQNTKLKTFIQKEKILLSKQKNDLNSLRDVLQDASECDQIWTDIKELNKKISSIDMNFDSETNIEDLREQLNEKKNKLDEIDSKIGSLQDIINTVNLNYTERHNLLNSNEKQLIEMRKEEHLMSSYKQKIDELNQEIDDLDDKIMDSTNKQMEFEPKIRRIDEQIKETEQQLRDFEAKIQIQLNRIRDKQRDLERLNKDIEIHFKSGNSDKIIKLSEELASIEKDLSKVEKERQQIASEISRLSEEISSFEVRKRELNDNQNVFNIQNEINNEKSVLRAEEEKLGFSNIQELKAKKKELEREVKKLEQIRTQSESKQMPIINMIDKLEQDIKREPYKSCKNNYKLKFIELSISEVSAEDLNKYYKALDFAVSDFHRKKIAEINKLVEGFWKQAYRGTDIDYIKIVSDEEERSADKRRTFNYRVVMVKGGAEMDMRGRCSAGQKVLASLIIRLALAEIFCTNCSVLALDEPTTNLDKHNIESFATAVSQIVKYRKKWKNSNFQLIIITHDEEFLRCLDSETGQYYYKVYKNDSGFSTILRKSIDDQNSDNE